MVHVSVAVPISVPGVVLALVVGFYSAWRATKGDEKFAILRSFGLAFGSLGGTSFSGTNLTDANFTNALLKNTNFANSRKQLTNLTRTHWQDAKKLNKARPGDSILANFKVLKLLTTGQGINQDFSHLNLRGANLDAAQLNGANLKNTDLSQASLRQADLQNANLTELQAIGTDFTAAYFTAACIENWNIDATTQLDDIDCQYIFLKAQPNAKGSRERRPHDPDQCFAPGDFTKLYQKILNTVEVLLQDGYRNPEAFRAAFAAFMETNPDITPDAIREIKRIGDHDAQITLKVPPDTDKAQLARQLTQVYEENRQLLGKVETFKTLSAAEAKRADNLQDLFRTSLIQPHSVTIQNNQQTGDNPMTTQDNQAISTGDGSFVNTGNITGSTVNLGTISGNVTNTLNQLATQPATKEIATHLKAFQTAIETDPHLPDPDKADALEQVSVLAAASQDPAKPENETLSRKALKLLQGTIAAVPKATSFIEACTKLLPLISKFFGL
jgi:uncharacterized protein YjbI with pentapeptide repeats